MATRQKRKVKVTSPCLADRYAAVNERIVEFSGTAQGGLISIRESEDGSITIQVYRADPRVYILAGGEIHSTAATPLPLLKKGC